MAAHKAWRVKPTAIAGGGAFMSAVRIEFRGSTHGADLTQTVGGTAFADSFYAPEGDVAARAYDSNTTTYWACNGTGTACFIGWIFPTNQDVKCMVYSPRSPGFQAPSALKVQWSDDTTTGLDGTWTDAWVVTTIVWPGGTDGFVMTTETLDPTETYGWHRFHMTAAQEGGGVVALARLEAYTAVGGADQLAGSGATITASSTFGGFPVSNLTDGSDATAWAASSTDAYIQIAWLVAKNIREWGWKGRTDFFGQAPRDGRIWGSKNGVDWLIVWTYEAIAFRHVGTTYNLIKMRNPDYVPSTTPNRRLWGLKFNTVGSSPPHIKKAELRNSAGGANICTGGNALACRQFDGSYDPEFGWDGTSSFATPSTTNGYLWYDFGEGNEKGLPAEIMLQDFASFPTRMPLTFDLVYRDWNGGPITVQQSFTTPNTWTANEIRTFAITGGGVVAASKKRGAQIIGRADGAEPADRRHSPRFRRSWTANGRGVTPARRKVQALTKYPYTQRYHSLR